MALVRCPSCGRVADGKMCFACGYEWPANAPPVPPAPTAPASPSPSQVFKIASPASYPTAAVVARAPTPTTPAAPTPPMPPDEIDLDVDFDERRPSATFPANTAPVFGGAPASAFLSPSDSFSAAPAFPTPSGAFGSSPPAAFSASSFPPAAFGTTGSTPPAPAFPTPSGSFGTPAFGTSPPPAFPTASGSFGGGGGFGASPMPAFPTSSPPVPAALAPDPWGAPPAPEMAATPSPRAPSMKYAAAGVASSWSSNPTVQVSAAEASAMMHGLDDKSASVADAKLARAGWDDLPDQSSLPSTPASLTGLFDGLNQPTSRAEPTTVQAPMPPADDDVHDATDEAGDIFNFTLEPGSTVEPEPSPFETANGLDDSVDVDMSRPSSSRSLSIEFADDAPSAPPPGAGVGLDSGFAEIDPMDLESALPDVDMASPPAAFDPFSEPAPAPSSPTPAFVEAPAPAEAPADVDEASFADVEFSLDAEMADAAEAPRELDGEAAFDALGGLDDFGELPASPEDQAGLDALAELDREIASLGASLPPEPIEDFEAPTVAISSSSSPAPVPAAKGSTLSSRVGTLAESLEEAGRIAEAAMLYEVQAVLAAAGR